MTFLKGIFDSGYKELKRVEKIADKVCALQDEYRKLSDYDLQNKTEEFRKRLANGASLDSLIVEAFATVREAATRVLGMTPFRVQIIGALAMHGGNISEMKTGEGKTLTSTMVAYLNALPQEGVHIVTVNEYLASRDAEEMGKLFKWLGLTVGLNLRELSPEDKKAQYLCDITYSTNSELGFDYLRDHMAIYKENIVQRPLNFAIVDEVDSILVDEARTPLIISGASKKTENTYKQADLFVKGLNEADYEIDIKGRHILLNESGMSKAEGFFNIANLYDVSSINLLHRINNALRANYIMSRDIDYVVQDGKVVIVDSFTGRLMHGRQYSDGLHQALEAKENVEIKKETRTIATITYQNYFRMYKKLAGMTGTAKTEEEEFRNIYNMYVVEVPTNVPVIRKDEPDLIFMTKKAKFDAIAKDIKMRHEAGQPVLVGTISIETSEYLSGLLKKLGVPHNVLNAKQHEREAEIVLNAGQIGQVTIATNMAGRGTDIKLGEGVKELGGLAVLGTERHESRRIDNQLRGRSGRQGDPGYSRFYLSAEDDLMKRFGSERFKSLLGMVVENDKPLESKLFTKQVESSQKRIEGMNYDIRKTTLEYDEVLRKQREIIYQQRNDVLFKDDITDIIIKMIHNASYNIVAKFADEKNNIDPEGLFKELNGRYLPFDCIKCEDLQDLKFDEVAELFAVKSIELLEEKHSLLPDELYKEGLKVYFLKVIDTYWMNHIDDMSELRQSVGLQSYAQQNPLRMYREIGFDKFEDMIASIEIETVRIINLSKVQERVEREEVVKITGTSSGSDEQPKKKSPVKKQQEVGRNELCPCGSGKKYKHCCGK